MKELWKDIKGFEGQYEISSFGRCRTVEHVVSKSDGVKQLVRSRIKKPHINNKGYLAYSIGSHKRVYAHRLVAEAFIPNPQGFKEIDHVDTNKTNNKVYNLRWTDRKGNCNNPLTREKMKSFYDKLKKPIVELDIYGNYVKTWKGASDIIKAKKYTSIYINRSSRNIRLTGDRIYVSADSYKQNDNYAKLYGRKTRYINAINQYSVVELSNNGCVVNVFTSSVDAAKHFGITRGSVVLRCNNRKRGLQARKSPLIMFFKDINDKQQKDALVLYHSATCLIYQKPS